jgi:hypothetical protein
VPLDVIGEHAEKDVGTDPIGQVMVDEADLEVDGLVASKRLLDVGQVFVGAHGLLGSISLHIRVDDVDPIEGAPRQFSPHHAHRRSRQLCYPKRRLLATGKNAVRRASLSVRELRDAADDRGGLDDRHPVEPVGPRFAPLVRMRPLKSVALGRTCL